MTEKLLAIIATGDKEKALTGLMYTKNAIKLDWLKDIKVVYFGPSEKLMVEDSQVRDEALDLASLGECFACKAISDRENISDKVDEMGIKVEYVGSIISEYIKQGYVPMVW
jgi:hypothetical protein